MKPRVEELSLARCRWWCPFRYTSPTSAPSALAIAKEKGALAGLVAVLRDGSVMGKEKAAGALSYLAVNADNKVAIAKAEGALVGLVALLRDGSAAGKERAAGAVKQLAHHAENKASLLKLGCDASAFA